MSRRRPRTIDDEQRSPLTYIRPGDTLLDPAGGECTVLWRHGGRLMVADADGFKFILQSRRIAEGRWRHQAGNAPLPGALRQTAAVGLDPASPTRSFCGDSHLTDRAGRAA